MKRKLISSLLILAMLTSLFPTTALAESMTTAEALKASNTMTPIQSTTASRFFSNLTTQEQQKYCETTGLDRELILYTESKGVNLSKASAIVVKVQNMESILQSFVPWVRVNGLKVTAPILPVASAQQPLISTPVTLPTTPDVPVNLSDPKAMEISTPDTPLNDSAMKPVDVAPLVSANVETVVIPLEQKPLAQPAVETAIKTTGPVTATVIAPAPVPVPALAPVSNPAPTITTTQASLSVAPTESASITTTGYFSLNQRKALIDQLIGGVNYFELLESVKISLVLGADPTAFIRRDTMKVSTGNATESKLTQQYHLNSSALNDWMKLTSLTWDSIEKAVTAYEGYMKGSHTTLQAPKRMMSAALSADASKQGVVSNYLNDVYGYKKTGSESVGLSSGNLSWNTNLVNVPGTNGMNLALGIRYNSQDANLEDSGFNETIAEGYANYSLQENVNAYVYDPVYQIWNPVLPSTLGLSGEAAGGNTWGIFSDLIRIQKSWNGQTLFVKNYKGPGADLLIEYSSTFAVLTPGTNGVTGTSQAKAPALINNYVAAGWSYELPYIKIENVGLNSSSFTNQPTTIDMGNGTQYGIDYKDLDSPNNNGSNGLIGYAKLDMKLVKVTSNSVVTYELRYKDGSKKIFSSDGSLKQTADRYGNFLNYAYKVTPQVLGDTTVNVYALKSITDTAGRTITLTDTGGSVTITPPAGAANNVVLNRSAAGTGNYALSSISRPLGNNLSFDYASQPAGFSLTRKTDLEGAKNYLLLKTVTYPTKGTTNYEWSKSAAPLTDLGSFEYYQVKKRYELEGTVQNNAVTYDYPGDHIGYGHSQYMLDAFAYQTIATEVGGSKSLFSFNSINQPTLTTIQSSAGISLRDILPTYNQDHDKISEKVTYYGPGNFRTTQESWSTDEFNDLLSHTDPSGTVTTWTYDPVFHRPKSQNVQFNGKTQTTSWDINAATGNVDSTTELFETGAGQGVRKTTFTYDTAGNVLTSSIALGGSKSQNIAYTYLNKLYPSQKKITATKADGMTQSISLTYAYDSLTGRLTSETDGDNSHATTYTYDLLGRMAEVTNADGSKKVIAYDDDNRSVSFTQENGYTLKSTYDTIGRMTEKADNNTGSLTAIQKIKYDVSNRPFELTDAKGNTSTFAYDDLNRPLSITHPDGKLTTTSYDDGQNQKIETNEDGAVTTTVCDNSGNITSIGVGTNFSNFTYDGLGNRLTEKDPNGNVTNYSYNEQGWLLSVTSPKNDKTSYVYNLLGNPVSLNQQEYDATNALSRTITTTKAYDELGRLIKDTDALGKTETTTYDVSGNPSVITDRNGGTITFTYDKLNRPATRSGKPYGGTIDNNTAWNYTTLFTNNNFSVTHNGRMATDTLNPNGSLQTEVVDGKTTSYTYDANGNRSGMTDPFGLTVGYTYDEQNRLSTLTAGGKKFTYGYYDDGMIKSLAYPNGTQSAFNYDSYNQLISLQNTLIGVTGPNTGSSSYGYGYDNNGNINSGTENGVNTTYVYDPLNRLTQNTQGASQLNYTFDARGNRTQLNGNIPDCILNPVRDINRNFTWNSLNQMSGFKSGNETAVTTNATYNYNQDGLRYQKTVATTIGAATTTLTTKYFYDDGGRTIAETNSANAVQAQVVWGHKPLMRIVGGNNYYYHYNGHGDVVSISDSTGKAVNTYTYDTWGNLTSKVETIDNPILYSGEYYDKESGLYYLRARMYDPVDGRFISRDSYEGKLTNPMSQNRYSYCVNNPLKYSDPTGHEILQPGIKTLEQDLPTVEQNIGFISYAMTKVSKLGESVMSGGVTSEVAVAGVWCFKTGEGYLAKFVAKGWGNLSVNKIEHVLKSHTMIRMQNTVDKMMAKGLTESAENLVNSKGFFNTSWSESKVISATNKVYREALAKGVPNSGNFKYTTTVFGEKITVNFNDGIFSSAWGYNKLTLFDFGY